MISRDVELEEHLGHPVLREKIPTVLARITLAGDKIDQSILLHPRYVPERVKFEIITTRVFHRGRTIDIFLDEPMLIKGEEYGILNFKGVGADADREMVINPSWWYYDIPSKWVARHDANPFDKVWGAVTEAESLQEYFNPILERFGINYTPSIAMNRIPLEIEEQIRNIENEKEEHCLCQIVRAQKTNIRGSDVGSYDIGYRLRNSYPTVQRIAEIDASVVKAQLELAKRGEMLVFVGVLNDNRLIDGTFTDLDNYHIETINITQAASFIAGIILDSIITFFAGDGMAETYLKELEKRTEIPFSEFIPSKKDVGSVMYKALERVAWRDAA